MSVYEVIHQGLSQHRGRLNEMIEAYNNQLPVTTITDKLGRTRSYRKGMIRGTQSRLAEQLIYLCLRQMEELRRSENPSDHLLYRCYLESDRLPVITNRQELTNLQRANKSEICRSTINNHLRLLEAAGIILKKRSTSRRRVQREDGTVIYQTDRNGRGNFQLFLSKRIFHFHLDYEYLCVEGQHQSDVEKPREAVEKPTAGASGAEKASDPANFSTIEDQSITTATSLTLEQLIPESNKTKKWIDNNSGKLHCTPSGVPPEHDDHVSELRSQLTKLERDSMDPKLVAARRGENPAAGAPAAALDVGERLRRQREASEQRRLLNARVARLVPGKEREFYLEMLQLLFISMLYPELNRFYLQQIKPGIRSLLGLYWDLVYTGSPQETFRKLSRAVEMVYRYQQKHPDYELYDPLAFLRMDYRGGFHTVVTKWLPKEEMKLKMHAEKRSHLIKWQQGQAFADDLFDGVVEALRTGLASSRAVFAEAQLRLNGRLKRLKAADKTKARIKASFEDRLGHLYRELLLQAEELEDDVHDQTWAVFERWRKMNGFMARWLD